MESCPSSDDENCATALPYLSDVHLIRSEDAAQLTPDSFIETSPLLLLQLREEFEQQSKRGEDLPLIFIKDMSEIKTENTLRFYLKEYGNFPLAHSVAATFIRDICCGLIFLHRKKLAHCSISSDFVVFDGDGRLNLVVPRNVRHAHDIEERDFRTDDMFRFGEMIYRMITGQQPHFDENDNLSKLAPVPYAIPTEPLKLATILLSKFPQMRPTVGSVLYNPWMEENAAKLENLTLL